MRVCVCARAHACACEYVRDGVSVKGGVLYMLEFNMHVLLCACICVRVCVCVCVCVFACTCACVRTYTHACAC